MSKPLFVIDNAIVSIPWYKKILLQMFGKKFIGRDFGNFVKDHTCVIRGIKFGNTFYVLSITHAKPKPNARWITKDHCYKFEANFDNWEKN